MSDCADNFEIGPSGAGTCASCRPHGRCRLGVGAVTVLADGRVTVDAVCPNEWQGGPNVAHGGWISAAFDEALAHLVLPHDPRVVTQHLAVHYQRPVPVLEPLRFHGQILGREGRTWQVSAELTLGASGPPLASAEATFVSRREDHYRRHEAWLQATRLANTSMLS